MSVTTAVYSPMWWVGRWMGGCVDGWLSGWVMVRKQLINSELSLISLVELGWTEYKALWMKFDFPFPAACMNLFESYEIYRVGSHNLWCFLVRHHN